MFEPIPLEMLYTDAQKPQVLIKVNGIDGVCPDFNCDYVYVDTTSIITSQTLSGETLTIVGTNLPTSDVSVALANSVCGTVTATTTQISCTLTTPSAAGAWDVVVTDLSGLIPVQGGTTQISVALTVSSVSPASGLNQLGGDTIVLTGTGFDVVIENTSITFSDGTTCTVTSSTSTQLSCTVSEFDSASL